MYTKLLELESEDPEAPFNQLMRAVNDGDANPAAAEIVADFVSGYVVDFTDFFE